MKYKDAKKNNKNNNAGQIFPALFRPSTRLNQTEMSTSSVGEII